MSRCLGNVLVNKTVYPALLFRFNAAKFHIDRRLECLHFLSGQQRKRQSMFSHCAQRDDKKLNETGHQR
ncbi:hypothetical protein ACOMHN_029981 [Nucella lapillus]